MILLYGLCTHHECTGNIIEHVDKHNMHLSFPGEYEDPEQQGDVVGRINARAPNWRYLHPAQYPARNAFQESLSNQRDDDSLHPGRKYVGGMKREYLGARQQNELSRGDDDPVPDVENSMWKKSPGHFVSVDDTRAQNDKEAQLSEYKRGDRAGYYDKELTRLLEKRARRLG
jgi:hypothetical protein